MDARRARFFLTYGQGAEFVRLVEYDGGRELSDRLLEMPPRHTSTVFHPERYDATGERPPPDAVAMLRSAGFDGAAAASELDLRARWMDELGGERVRSSFSGFLSGSGMQDRSVGVSLSVHESADSAEAYARGLRIIYRLEGEAGAVEGGFAAVLRRGRAVSGALGPSVDEAKASAGRALDAAGEFSGD
jgi:hypothetical protein